jgi:transcriptional regulator with XRE-family HTH domain
MRNFEKQLLRLKQAIGATKDQEVASALGMSPAAFSDRKKRDAFPVEKVYALAARHPDLQLDVDYIVTGTSDRQKELNRRLLAVKNATQKAASLGLPDVYARAVQEILFFVEMEDGKGVLAAFEALFRDIAASIANNSLPQKK